MEDDECIDMNKYLIMSVHVHVHILPNIVEYTRLYYKNGKSRM